MSKKDNLQGLSIEIKQNDRLSQNGLQQNNKLTKNTDIHTED